MHKNGFEDINNSLRDLRISKPILQNNPHRDKGRLPYPHPNVDNYYAVNAPAPGTVGMASARVNKPYTDTQNTGGHQDSIALSKNHQYNGVEMHRNNFHHYTNALPQNLSTSNASIISEGRKHYANMNMGQSREFASYGYDEEFPPAPPSHYPRDPYPPQVHRECPPSPVSSSYSELRHTQKVSSPSRTQYPIQPHQVASHNPSYAPLSHTSSTYESIYESLNSENNEMPQMKSYHGPYSSPSALGLAPAPTDQPIINPDRVGKEAEVDALTSLLVQSMDSSADPEFFGMCARCGIKVMGEGNGCTAMEQVFHIRCFTCVLCMLKLQGKPFYALESKPYCEDCYLDTLEKCCVCTKPILDRILRATGKPYHPRCFSCVVCRKSLDGIPFTVDASNQIHCIDDFHRKFAPRCSVCGEPIMPEAGKEETVRVVALDRSFHVGCYKCEDCGLVLSSEAEGKGCYPLDEHVLCKSCNARRVQKLTSKVSTDL